MRTLHTARPTGAVQPKGSALRLPGLQRGIRSACAALLLVVATGAAATAVVDDGPPPEPEGGISGSDKRGSVRVFSTDAVRVFSTDAVRVFSIDGSVTSLGDGVEVVGDTSVISLSSDLLFPPNSWELPASAPGKIADLVSDVPQGATVQVTGHTDSVPTGADFDNVELSQERAEAVAGALRDERPDLDLEVSGVGDAEPAEREDPDDPSTFAANRRVEIAYEG
ncbi:OmpA/MotB family protein [Pseudactinotalea sp. Z1739]|uniref:OmpA/MotB family protein n=1 Tax=Pseudactinotalea sp. Z1739 TaxID=3413028 RepID=UPI003C7D51BF